MAEQWRRAHAVAGVQLDTDGSFEGQNLDTSRPPVGGDRGGSLGSGDGSSVSIGSGGSCPTGDGHCPSRNGDPRTAFFSTTMAGDGSSSLPDAGYFSARDGNLLAGESALVTDANVGSGTVRARSRFCGTMAKTVAWNCHLHRSATCRIVRDDKWYWHAVPVKRLDAAAQVFNTLNGDDEFREVLGGQMFVTPIADVQNLSVEIFDLLICALWWLDAHRYRFTQYSKASDLVRRHIVYDAVSCLAVVNKHLLRKVAPKPGGYYTRPRFVMDILRELFPKISDRSNIKSTTPVWAINRFQEMSSLARRLKLETSRTAVEARLRRTADPPGAPISMDASQPNGGGT